MRKLVAPFDRTIEGLLVFSVVALMAFSLLTMIFRWTQVSALWVDPLVRHLVFINIFLGGVIACQKGQHIGIDILGKLLEGKKHQKLRRGWQVFLSLVSMLGSLALSYSGYEYFLIEREYGDIGMLGVHTSFLVGIIPVGFLLIAIRFALQTLIYLFEQEA